MKKQMPLHGVGAVLVLTVLTVLLSAVFAVLSLTTALADLALSEKTARAVSQYYALDAQAAALVAGAIGGQPSISAEITGGGRIFEISVSPGGGRIDIERWSFGAARHGEQIDFGIPIWNGD